jgi:dimethylamine/trimethylamine dehydrogenase
LQLANRGYAVTLAEAGESLGGRVSRECELPGMSSYARVRDYRENLLRQMPNVEIYVDNRLRAEDVVELGIPNVFVATGARWRRDGVGRQNAFPIPGIDAIDVLTPDDVLDGRAAEGNVLIYDDDHYYIGGAVAELLRERGHEVCLLTPESKASIWTENTLEQEKIQARLLDLGVEIIVSHRLRELGDDEAVAANVYDERRRLTIGYDSLVVVTARLPEDDLYQALCERREAFRTLRAIGDCHAPGTVAAAVYDGHSAARHLDSDKDIYAPLFTRDMPVIE